ncbi:hypothetical protein [Pedobacter psychroterrae]|uniref:Adhesin n=1 Tax=Pedobacter psychroterrae TaxID=2530453 RepID=A0A4R0NSV2_9SPHI|nr:hypothetical protein [Pedobacter psychroterrae]TCD02993.1 hypothetical protein EZ437_03165 [Pedobacter psychroterrae]
MKTLTKCAVVLLLLTNYVHAQEGPVQTKTFTKTFAADNSDKLMLSNQYGSIQIKIWDRKEVKADVDIKAYSNNDADAQKLLDEVSIEADKTGDQIAFKTKMDQNNKSWGNMTRNGKKWRREVKVNYIVYMPAGNALTLSQTYGNVTMGDLSGALYAKVQYGNFTAQNLGNANNYVSVQYGNTDIQSLNGAVIKQQYGSGVNIGTVGRLNLDAQYAAVKVGTIKENATIKQQYGSGLTIGSVDNLDLNAQYASVNITTIKGSAKINQQYNNLVIGTVGKLDLTTQYTAANVGTLNGDGKFNMDYNKLNIGAVTNGCKALTIDGDYLGITITFNDNYNADFEVRTSYASFKYGEKTASRSVGNNDNSTSKHYAGKIGSGGGATVSVKADYGSVAFK